MAVSRECTLHRQRSNVKVCAVRTPKSFRINSSTLLVEIGSSFYAQSATCAVCTHSDDFNLKRVLLSIRVHGCVCARLIYIQAEQNVRSEETFDNRMQFSMFEAPLCTSAIMQNCWLVATKQWGRKFATEREHRALMHQPGRWSNRERKNAVYNKINMQEWGEQP